MRDRELTESSKEGVLDKGTKKVLNFFYDLSRYFWDPLGTLVHIGSFEIKKIIFISVIYQAFLEFYSRQMSAQTQMFSVFSNSSKWWLEIFVMFLGIVLEEIFKASFMINLQTYCSTLKRVVISLLTIRLISALMIYSSSDFKNLLKKPFKDLLKVETPKALLKRPLKMTVLYMANLLIGAIIMEFLSMLVSRVNDSVIKKEIEVAVSKSGFNRIILSSRLALIKSAFSCIILYCMRYTHYFYFPLAGLQYIKAISGERVCRFYSRLNLKLNQAYILAGGLSLEFLIFLTLTYVWYQAIKKYQQDYNQVEFYRAKASSSLGIFGKLRIIYKTMSAGFNSIFNYLITALSLNYFKVEKVNYFLLVPFFYAILANYNNIHNSFLEVCRLSLFTPKKSSDYLENYFMKGRFTIDSTSYELFFVGFTPLFESILNSFYSYNSVKNYWVLITFGAIYQMILSFTAINFWLKPNKINFNIMDESLRISKSILRTTYIRELLRAPLMVELRDCFEPLDRVTSGFKYLTNILNYEGGFLRKNNVGIFTIVTFGWSLLTGLYLYLTTPYLSMNYQPIPLSTLLAFQEIKIIADGKRAKAEADSKRKL